MSARGECSRRSTSPATTLRARSQSCESACGQNPAMRRSGSRPESRTGAPATGPEAIKALDRAVALDPKLAPAHLQLGIALRRQGDPERALEQFRLAAGLAPKDPQSAYEYGKALKETAGPRGRDRAIPARPRVEARFRTGAVFAGRRAAAAGGRGSWTAHSSKRSATCGPSAGNSPNRNWRSTPASRCSRTGMSDGALERFEAATKTSPTFAPGFYCLGLALDQKGRV